MRRLLPARLLVALDTDLRTEIRHAQQFLVRAVVCVVARSALQFPVAIERQLVTYRARHRQLAILTCQARGILE